jgi:hypothetical protein
VTLLAPWAQTVDERDFDVKRHGARGNGGGDDTAAVQRTLDAVGSAYLPRGDYRIEGQFEVPEGGAIWTWPPRSARLNYVETANQGMLAVGGHNVGIYDVVIHGPYVGQRPVPYADPGADPAAELTHTAIVGTAPRANALTPADPILGFKMRNVEVSGFGYGLMFLEGFEGWRVEGCLLEYGGREGLKFSSGRFAVACANHFRHILGDDGTGTFPWFNTYPLHFMRRPRMEVAGQSSTDLHPRSGFITVYGNIFEDCPAWAAIDGHGVEFIVAFGNVSKGVYMPFSISEADTVGLDGDVPTRDVAIFGNASDGDTTIIPLAAQPNRGPFVNAGSAGGHDSPGSIAATLTTALAGANNDLVFTETRRGPKGNSVTITYAVAGLNTPLSVVVAGNDVTVNVATDGAGAATSTAAQVAAAVDAAPDPTNGALTIANAPANDGTGVVTAMAKTALSGGYAVGGRGMAVFGNPNRNHGSDVASDEGHGNAIRISNFVELAVFGNPTGEAHRGAIGLEDLIQGVVFGNPIRELHDTNATHTGIHVQSTTASLAIDLNSHGAYHDDYDAYNIPTQQAGFGVLLGDAEIIRQDPGYPGAFRRFTPSSQAQVKAGGFTQGRIWGRITNGAGGATLEAASTGILSATQTATGVVRIVLSDTFTSNNGPCPVVTPRSASPFYAVANVVDGSTIDVRTYAGGGTVPTNCNFDIVIFGR